MTLKHRIYRLLVNLKQRTSRLFSLLIVCLAALFGLNPSANADRWYVDGSLTPCGDGIGWGTAFKYLQDALDTADNLPGPHEIWVAETDPSNPYRPDQDCNNPGGTNNDGLSFEMITAVEVYGGFFGDEVTLEDRDIVANETVLSGDIGVLGDDSDNSINIVRFDQLSGSPAVLDGFTVRDGGTATFGGGIFVFATANAIIRNCILRDNDAVYGGGLGVNGTSAGDEVEVRNCLFEDNSGVFGGGIGSRSAPGDINVINCYFSANSAAFGGGVYSNTGPYTIINTTFTENSASTPGGDGDGGAAFFEFGVDALFINSLFLFNTSQDEGGAVYINGFGAAVDFINCTFSKNDTGEFGSGGGIVARNSSTTTITNCILWGNTDGDAGTDTEQEQLRRVNPASVTVTYTCIEGLVPGGQFDSGDNVFNIPDDPTFVDEDGNDPNAFDLQDDFRLSLGSLCIDVGDTGAVLCDAFDVDEDGADCVSDPEPTPDLDLINRVLDGKNEGGEAIVDMGSYEFIHPDICPWDVDSICDVGVSDFLELLGTWGPCPPMEGCPADFDDSGDVGVSDFLALLGNWGPCPCDTGPGPLSLEDELADACLTDDHWDDFVDVMTDPESSQEDQDRYNCWMIHLLDHCNNCTCTHKSECPNPNPFN